MSPVLSESTSASSSDPVVDDADAAAGPPEATPVPAAAAPPATPREATRSTPAKRARASRPAETRSGPPPAARRNRQIRARKVERLVRHVEPWSVLKISLVFYFCLWIIFTIASVMLWSAAVGSGMVDNVEDFIKELFALESFSFDADKLFRASAIAGLLFVVAGSGFTVLMAVLFNLISDLTGGIRISVVELETARPMTRRGRRRPPEPQPSRSRTRRRER